MAAGVTDKLWEIADIVARVEAKEAESRRRVAFTRKDGYRLRLRGRAKLISVNFG